MCYLRYMITDINIYRFLEAVARIRDATSGVYERVSSHQISAVLFPQVWHCLLPRGVCDEETFARYASLHTNLSPSDDEEGECTIDGKAALYIASHYLMQEIRGIRG